MGKALSAPLPGAKLREPVPKAGQTSTWLANHRLPRIPQSGRCRDRELGWESLGKIRMETFSQWFHGKAFDPLHSGAHEKLSLAMPLGAGALGGIEWKAEG